METRAIYVFHEAKKYELLQHVRESLTHAAERWGAELRVVKRTNQSNGYWCDKAVHAVRNDLDRCLWLDGDMLIRIDCPNPFELVPADRVGFVSTVQDQRKVLSNQPIVNGIPMPNGGFQLSGKTHREEGGYYRRLIQVWKKHNLNVYDQPALQSELRREGQKVTWLPSWFNYLMSPCTYTGAGGYKDRATAERDYKNRPRMPAEIVHAKAMGAGWSWKRALLLSMDWKEV